MNGIKSSICKIDTGSSLYIHGRTVVGYLGTCLGDRISSIILNVTVCTRTDRGNRILFQTKAKGTECEC